MQKKKKDITKKEEPFKMDHLFSSIVLLILAGIIKWVDLKDQTLINIICGVVIFYLVIDLIVYTIKKDKKNEKTWWIAR